MKNKKIIIGIAAIVTLIVLASLLLSQEEKSQTEFDNAEKAQVEELNSKYSGIGTNYNANGDNDNPSIDFNEISNNL